MTGIELIAAERQRQIEVEGYAPEHDDTHVKGEIAQAASVMASLAAFQSEHGHLTTGKKYTSEKHWPWQSQTFKPSDDAIRNLAKAGALIAAEIDRLKRKEF